VYVGVPPLNDAVVESVAVWPLLMTVGLTDIAGAVVAGFTTTETAPDVTVSTGEPLSVTLSSKDHEPTIDRTPVGAVGLSPALQENELPRLL
jgi:hypothetical protein